MLAAAQVLAAFAQACIEAWPWCYLNLAFADGNFVDGVFYFGILRAAEENNHGFFWWGSTLEVFEVHVDVSFMSIMMVHV